MTHAETIESLRCCFGFGVCSDCKAKSMNEEDKFPCKLDCKDRLGLYAADLIERLTAENAELRKEIEWKDMVISLAQREQAKAPDAADLIDRLTAENAELREKRLWKPVFGGGPEREGCYLVTVRHWLDGAPVAREAFWNGVDWLSCERRHEITPRVTHWMPLPEAAEEGEKA